MKDSLAEFEEKQAENDRKHEEITAQIEDISSKIDANQNKIYDILNEKSNINADNQRFKTMLEQLNIKKAELSSRIIQGKSQENAQDSVISSLENKLKETENTIAEYTLSIEHKNAAVADISRKLLI